MDLRSLPQTLETDDLPKKKLDKIYRPPTSELIAYLDFSVSTTGILSGVKVRVVLIWSYYIFSLVVSPCFVQYVQSSQTKL